MELRSPQSRSVYGQILIVVLAFTVLVFISSWFMGDIMNRHMTDSIEAAFNNTEINITADLQEMQTLLVYISETTRLMILEGFNFDAVSEYITQITEYMMKVDERFKEYATGVYGIFDIFEGKFHDGTGWQPPEGFVPANRPWYKAAVAAKGEVGVTEPYLSIASDAYTMTFSRRIYDGNGTPMGVVCLDILLDRVRDYAVNTFFTQGGYGLLVNRKIEVLAHPDKHMWGRALRDVNSGYVSLADGLEQGVPVIERRMKNYKNEASVVSFRHFKNGWHIGMVILEKEYFKEMRKMRLILIAVGIVLSALFSAILLRLSAARKELQYISESKSSFLASMSHEIRTPMNAITGMAELLLRRDLPDEARNDIRDIKQAGHNLISIINDILDLSKIEAGKLEIIPVEYLLASLIKDTVNIVRMRLEEKPILFYADIDSNIPNSLIGDEVRLRQIMLNLLSNAVKYTEKGHISLTITAEERDSEQVRLKITVADTGKGIKPEDAKKLFGNFVQVDTKKNRGIEGTGLGLAITKRLCDAMGGDISVESEYGKGSVFTVSIPQGINPTESFATVDTKSFIEKAGEVRFTIPHARLLIVDDIAINLKVAEGLLSPYNAIVDTCPGGAEAVEMVKRNRYDLVFMDHMMPEVDGIEATAAIREWEALTMSSEQLAGGKIAESSEKRVMRSAVPIIALTANAVVGMKETFIEKGFNDFLSKPIDTSMLDEIIDRWIPEEKKNKNSQTPSSHCSLLTAHCSLSDIPGIDIKRGIAMLGGKEQMYRKLLALFCADAEQRIAILKDSVEDIAAVAKQAHAFRGVTANLGAAEISAEAAQLEAACKAGDINRMKLNMDGFIKHLTELVNNISLAIK